jgi:hypothetical protein
VLGHGLGRLVPPGLDLGLELFAAAEAPVAPGPRGGLEPVQALSSLTDIAMRRKGLLAGEVRPLGEAWPRNWL